MLGFNKRRKVLVCVLSAVFVCLCVSWCVSMNVHSHSSPCRFDMAD